MNRRALAVSLVLALLGTALLLLYLQRFEQEVSGGERIELLMVVKPIERGAVIQDEMLATRLVPAAYVEDRAVKAGERAKVIGLTTSTAVSPQQTLLWTDLAITTEDRELSSLVQPGKRAVAVRTAAGMDDANANSLIRPGDYVDVIFTMSNEGEVERSATVLLQRVLVLAVGRETQAATTSDSKGRDNPFARDKVLTLSLNLQEAQLLGLALERGTLSVAVRNPEDPWTQSDVPDVKASALLDHKLRAEAQRPPSSGPVKIEPSSAR